MYMLTEPHGLNYITHCEEEGFHTHPKEPPLYEVSLHFECPQLWQMCRLSVYPVSLVNSASVPNA